MRTRSLTKLASLSLVGAMALTACGSTKDDGGGLSGDGGGSTSVVTIAFEGPLSGDNAQLGINEVNGVKLAIDQANKKGDLGFTLKLLEADDMGDPAKAPAAAATAIQDKTVMGVIGPSFSGASQAVAPKYGEAGITMVNPSASNGTLQDQGFPTWHRIMPNDFAEGPAAADWLATKAKKVVVISDKSAYGDGVARSVEAQLKAKGVGIIYISHKMDEIFRIADEISVLRDGCLIDTRPAKDLDIDTVIRLMVGRRMESVFPERRPRPPGRHFATCSMHVAARPSCSSSLPSSTVPRLISSVRTRRHSPSRYPRNRRNGNSNLFLRNLMS